MPSHLKSDINIAVNRVEHFSCLAKGSPSKIRCSKAKKTLVLPPVREYCKELKCVSKQAESFEAKDYKII